MLALKERKDTKNESALYFTVSNRSMAKTYVGIDLGSTTVKAVALNGRVLASAIKPTGANPRKTGEAVLEQVLQTSGGSVDKIIATGYGRVTFSADEIVSEITAHAKGSNHLFPGARTVIDIGGQDSKSSRIDSYGRILDFAMNDRCAARHGQVHREYRQGLRDLSGGVFTKISCIQISCQYQQHVHSLCRKRSYLSDSSGNLY